MAETELDSFPVELLGDRYQIGHNALYHRLGKLGIKPFKVDRRAYVTQVQLRQLDQLHEHLSQGGTISGFLGRPDEQHTEATSLHGGLVPMGEVQVSLAHLVTSVAEAVAGAVVTSMRSTAGVVADAVVARLSELRKDSDPLEYLRTLEEAHTKGWVLSTSELAYLLRLSPRTITEYGQTFEDSGFLFRRTGKKRGELAWVVDKAGRPAGETLTREEYQPHDPDTGYPQF